MSMSRLRKNPEEELKQKQTKARREIERDICGALSRGSISLQQRNYITQEDMDVSLQEHLKFFSSDESKW